jgi:flagellar basal-body rod protein FlgG
MLDALYISAIGLQAQKEQLDAMANNVANVATPAFKRQSVDFSAILDRAPIERQSEPTGPSAFRPNRVLRVDFAPGEVHQTGRPLDVAIIGPGFFEVALAGEETGYSRTGSLQVGADGVLSLASGEPLKADIRVPDDASDVQIQPDGSVTALLQGDSERSVLGEIELATFSNPELLQYRGAGVFTAPAGVEPTRALPGQEGAGQLQVHSLEGSNVQLTDELVALLLTQRIYELNSRIAQAADEMIGMSNNLRNN